MSVSGNLQKMVSEIGSPVKYGLPLGDALAVSEEAGQAEIEYPALKHPVVVRALNFDKTPEIRGIFLGIKGQYLMAS